MKQIDDGGPAFSFGQVSELTGKPINGYHNDGMSLRDWFAGQVLAGWQENYHSQTMFMQGSYPSKIVKVAYSIADEMLSARKEVQP